jgi:endonuclease YncB( thermonuclease family)
MFASVKRICKWPPVKDEKTKDKVVKKEEEEEEEARTEEKKVEKTRHPLTDVTYDDLPEFMAKGVFDCKVIRVYDGDTVWAAIFPVRGCDQVSRVCCRLMGIDAPEMPKSSYTDKPMSDYHRSAFAARDRLVELLTDRSASSPFLSDHALQAEVDDNRAILDRGLELTHKRDKYGRYLARVRTRDGRDASDVMLQEGHAVHYDGGHRDPEPEQR